MSDTPGPDVAVKARAPFQLAPSTMPMAASSSSAWMNAKFFLPLSGSTRSLSANPLNASITEVDGVMGYHAATVAPAYTQPSPAAVLPSIMMWPAVFEPCANGATFSGKGQDRLALA
jgi:hypothetical protein